MGGSNIVIKYQAVVVDLDSNKELATVALDSDSMNLNGYWEQKSKEQLLESANTWEQQQLKSNRELSKRLHDVIQTVSIPENKKK